MLITGAAGQIAYSLIQYAAPPPPFFARRFCGLTPCAVGPGASSIVASGQTLGADQRVIIHLLDIEAMLPKLKGVVMEIEDCAYPLLAGTFSPPPRALSKTVAHSYARARGTRPGLVATASEKEAFT